MSGGVPLAGQARVARGSVDVDFGDEPSSTEVESTSNQRAMTPKDHGEPWADPIAHVGRLGSRSVETRPAWRSHQEHLLVSNRLSCPAAQTSFMPPMHRTRLMSTCRTARLLAPNLMRERHIRRYGLRARPYPPKGGSLTRPMFCANVDGAHLTEMPTRDQYAVPYPIHGHAKCAFYQGPRQPIGAARRRRWSD